MIIHTANFPGSSAQTSLLWRPLPTAQVRAHTIIAVQSSNSESGHFYTFCDSAVFLAHTMILIPHTEVGLNYGISTSHVHIFREESIQVARS